MKWKAVPLVVIIGAIWGSIAVPACAASMELEQAVSLLRETHADRCQQSALRARVLVAHRTHDQATIDQLYPQLEALNARLQPAEAKLKSLAAIIQQNTGEISAFESAQLENGECG